MMRRIAVVGDELSTGGRIVSYEGPMCIWGDSGRQAALIGGEAWCEKCKGAGRIAKAGGPRRIQFMGEIALGGDIVLCNCPTPPHIVAELAGESWCDDEAEKYAARKTTEAAIAFASSSSAAAVHHDEQYTLMDSDGRALASVRYRIVASSGRVSEGTTNSSGQTERIPTDGSERLKLYSTGGSAHE
ncbi:PAAR domain-containing protein [Paraburkholderia bannensis]|uniref:PAAR domain-containing protein n=1 Tax=Paraburkholderia bannensis TaxID=765414 RepID=UPI0009FC0254|nr:PAAR domain-containing protein [Paraburkholderia bannensis]